MKFLAASFVKVALTAGAWHASVLAEAPEKKLASPAAATMMTSTIEKEEEEEFLSLWSPPQNVEDDVPSSVTTDRFLLLEDLNVQVTFEDVHHEDRNDGEEDVFQGLLIDHATLHWSPHLDDENSFGDYRDFEEAALGSLVMDDGDDLADVQDAHHDTSFNEHGDFEGYEDWIRLSQELMSAQEELKMQSEDWGGDVSTIAEGSTENDLLQALEELASLSFIDLEDENDESENVSESEASEDQQTMESAQVRKTKGLRAHRVLDSYEDGGDEDEADEYETDEDEADWSIPTRSELLELILKQIESEKREGQIRENLIIEAIGMHLLNKHPNDYEWKTLLHDQVMDELFSLLVRISEDE